MTNSELYVLCCIYNGDSYKEIAKTRFVSEATIKSQVNSILKKFDMKRMKDVVQVLQEVDFSRIAAMMQRH